MDLPPTEVCQQLLASHVLLGAAHLTDERREEFRQELIKFLAAHGLKWTDWPDFFSLQNMQSTQALPSVNSGKVDNGTLFDALSLAQPDRRRR
jgi:hypothetical protein